MTTKMQLKKAKTKIYYQELICYNNIATLHIILRKKKKLYTCAIATSLPLVLEHKLKPFSINT